MHVSAHRLRHGEHVVLARLLGVSTRTLRNWRDREGRTCSPGRPPHDAEMRARVRAQIERVWPLLPRGHHGWRSVCEMLLRDGVNVPTRLVQSSVRALKREGREHAQARIEANRVHVEVLARDALWALDQTHLLRDDSGEVKVVAVRECLAPRTLGLSIGSPACGADVVRLLQHVAEQRGAWPLVIQMDNGPENKNPDVDACLRRARVVALWNEPHTPQHNPRAERGFGDLKLAVGMETGGPLRSDPVPAPTRDGVCARLLRAWHALDADTPRASLSGLTPAELDRIALPAEDRVRRARFYAEVCEELQRAALAPINARARRKAEREAIWCALEKYGLVKRTRGGCSVPTLKGEGIS